MEPVACGFVFCRANFEGFESWTNGFLIRNEEIDTGVRKVGLIR